MRILSEASRERSPQTYLLAGTLLLLVISSLFCGLSVILPGNRSLGLMVGTIALQTLIGVFAAMTFLLQQRQAGRLKQNKAFLKLLTQRIPSMLYQYQMKAFGQDSGFTYCSDGIQRLFGLKASDVVGLSYADSPLFKCVYPPDLEKIMAATTASMKAGGPAHCDFRVQQADQSLRWVRGDFYAERQADATYVWYGSCTDISELKEREEALRKQSITDELTGIYNRRYFMENLTRLIAQARRYAVEVSLVMIDLDHFKQINDRWGHEAGDQVLRQSCDLIRERLRITDIFCRVGGEEFAILCPHTDGPQAVQLADKLRRSLSATPMQDCGPITASFGVACWRPDEQGSELLRRADFATYSAKRNGRNTVVLSDGLSM